METRSNIITLLTDFGTKDYFVGAMKGVNGTIISPSRNKNQSPAFISKHLQR